VWLVRRLFGGTRREEALARRAEVEGDYPRAVMLFLQAGRLEEAARVMLLRAEAESNAAARLRLYGRAAATAPAGSAVHALARTRRALAVVAMSADAPFTNGVRRDLLDAAHELDELGEHAHAAAAYDRARDVEAQAGALELAGNVDGLEQLLEERHTKGRAFIESRRARGEFDMLVASGRRLEAVTVAAASSDAGVRERARILEARRARGSLVRAVVRGKRSAILLGERVVIGRGPAPAPPDGRSESADGTSVRLRVASAALSRDHLIVERRGEDVTVRDLGSRHGTELRGLALAGAAIVGEGIELRLGREVPLVVQPARDLDGAIELLLGATRYVAPLGTAYIGIGRWRLERHPGDWVTLATDDSPPAFSGAFQWSSRATLLAGDAVGTERTGLPELEIDL
jgi:tetratricopeptide (TPR) repeat protein